MAQKSLKKNAAYNFVKAFMNLAFPLISFPYASRVLMPSGIGKVNFINSFIDYFVLLAGLGIGSYATREAARIRDNKNLLNTFSSQILTINAISTIISYAILAITFLLTPKLREYKVLLVICSTKILFSATGVTWLYAAEEEYRYITIRSAIFQAFSLIFLFTFVRKPEDYTLYAMMGVISNVGSNICNFLYARKFISIRLTLKVNLKKHFRSIMIFFGESCASKIHTALDSVMLGFMLNDMSVGYYSAAQKIKVLVTQMITSITGTLTPRSSWYLEMNDKKGYRQMVQKAGNVACFFSLPAAIGIMAIARPLIMFFSGEAYLPALPSMLILAPSVVTGSISSFLFNVILTPNRLEKYSLQAQIIGSSLNILLNAIFIPFWGVFGASLSTMIVELTIMVVMMIHARKYLKGSKIFSSFLQALVGSLFMAVVVGLAIQLFESAFLQILAGILTGSLTYAVVMILLRNQSALMVLSMLKKEII
ncbi:MAG: flippase [Spirochaetaceae bacterium]|nr:flippase [Spirochaetaceae bacterium]